jgi:hypothetical protein
MKPFAGASCFRVDFEFQSISKDSLIEMIAGSPSWLMMFPLPGPKMTHWSAAPAALPWITGSGSHLNGAGAVFL